jgi:iron-sulfur cluster assembly protein
MLTITQDAGVAISALTTAQGVQETGGLRLQTLSQTDRFGRGLMDVSVAALADSGDLVVTENSTAARVFLDAPAAEILDDKVLDANRTVDGETRFTVRPGHRDRPGAVSGTPVSLA